MCTDHTLDVSVCLSVCLSHHESRVTPETVLHLSVLVWGYGLVPGQPLLQDVNTEHSLPTELNVLLFLITTECVLVLLVPHLLLLQLRCLLTHMGRGYVQYENTFAQTVHTCKHGIVHVHSVWGGLTDRNKYFKLKNSWGARAPLNLELLASNFPMYVQ